MKTATNILLYAALGFGLLAGTSGCEQCEVASNDGNTNETRTGFCSVKRFTGDTRSKSAALADGGNVTIFSVNGAVHVNQGNTNNVDVTFHPVVWRAFNTSDSEVRQNFDQLKTTVTADDAGNVTVRVSRDSGSPNTLGTDVIVDLPSSFAGQLNISQKNGEVDVDFPGNATQISVISGNGAIEVTNAMSPGLLKLTNSGSGDVSFAAGSIKDVEVSAHFGDIVADVNGVTDGAMGGSFRAEDGDIRMQMPTTGTYVVQATAQNSVDLGTPPSGCTAEEYAVNSKTVRCNPMAATPPTYTVDAQGNLAGTVTVTY